MFSINYRDSPLVLDERYPERDPRAVDAYRSGDDGTVQGGDSAPDASCLTHLGETSSTTLFDIFKPSHHTALVFPGSGGQASVTQVLEALRESSLGLVRSVLILPESSSFGTPSELVEVVTVVDTEGYAHKNYVIDSQDSRPTVVIVRPDGYVGGVVTSGSMGIRDYFSLILL
jgi:hypothetical protein